MYATASTPAETRTPSLEGTAPSVGETCVIGAGCSGLVACKALADAGIAFTCFEASDRVGGLWVFGNINGRSSAYRSLHINTSRDRMQFRDYPMPRVYPDYPDHTLIARYLADYAREFDLERHIRFRSEVAKVQPTADGKYEVTLASGERRRFGAIVVANGHHWDPHWPNPLPTGSFDGVELHSHSYVDPSHPEDLRGRRVVVVGIGNSAVDIACELSRATPEGHVLLAVRRGAWVLPKYVLGKPLDAQSALPRVLPRRLRQALAELWYHIAIGSPARFGLPLPDHHLGDAHPTVSDELFSRLASGHVRAKPHIVERRGTRVRFADGSEEPVDAIIYATGYRVSFPFFERDFVAALDNELSLFLRVFHPHAPHLYFIGLCQPLGPIMPIAEAQAKLVAAHLRGDYSLPSVTAMQAASKRERERVRRRFGGSPRHTMQVDFDAYLDELAREATHAVRSKRGKLGAASMAARLWPSSRS